MSALTTTIYAIYNTADTSKYFIGYKQELLFSRFHILGTFLEHSNEKSRLGRHMRRDGHVHYKLIVLEQRLMTEQDANNRLYQYHQLTAEHKTLNETHDNIYREYIKGTHYNAEVDTDQDDDIQYDEYGISENDKIDIMCGINRILYNC